MIFIRWDKFRLQKWKTLRHLVQRTDSIHQVVFYLADGGGLFCARKGTWPASI